MPTLPAPDPAQALFHVDAGLSEGVTYRGESEEPLARLTCGMPVATNLLLEYADWGKRAPVAVRQQLEHYDFWLVQFACTLATRAGAHVDRLKLTIQLEAPGYVPARGVILSRIQPGLRPPDAPRNPPIAYDMHPLRVVDALDTEEKLTLSPTIEFANVKVSPLEAGLTLKYTTPVPKVIAYGKGESSPYWELLPGTSTWVEPGVKELALVVRTDKRAATRATVTVEGKGRGLIFMRKLDQPSNNEFYF